MPPLGTLTQAWTSAEAALPLGWRVSGLYRFGELWVGLAEGPEFDDYASGSGLYAEQALRRLSDRAPIGDVGLWRDATPIESPRRDARLPLGRGPGHGPHASRHAAPAQRTPLQALRRALRGSRRRRPA